METTERLDSTKDTDGLTTICINITIAMNIKWQWKVDWQSTGLHKKACLGFWELWQNSFITGRRAVHGLAAFSSWYRNLFGLIIGPRTSLFVHPCIWREKEGGRHKVKQIWQWAWITKYFAKFSVASHRFARFSERERSSTCSLFLFHERHLCRERRALLCYYGTWRQQTQNLDISILQENESR